MNVHNVVHSAAQNGSDNFSSHPSDSQHGTDVVSGRTGFGCATTHKHTPFNGHLPGKPGSAGSPLILTQGVGGSVV